MALSDLTADCLDLAYDTAFGASAATHTAAADGTETACSVALDEGDAAEQRGADDLGAVARLRVRASEVAAVAAGDTFTVGSAVHEVMWARLEVDGLEWICDVSER